MARVLVTGGSGFIGSRVVLALRSAGHQVRVLDLVTPAEPPEGVEFTVGDVRDQEAVAAALAGMDAVDHHAATVGMGLDLGDLPRYTSNNDVGTAVLLAGMHETGVRTLVLASSMVVYGEGSYRCPEHGSVPAGPRREQDLAAGRFEPPCPLCSAQLEPGLVVEEAPMDPRSVYAVTKLTQEHLAAVWARESPGRAAFLRYHNVYGPGLPRDTPYAGVAAIFLSALLAGQAPVVFEDGGQRRDFVHVDDVARANVAALRWALHPGPDPASERVSAGGPQARAFNVASGIPRTVHDMAAELARAVSGPAPVVSGAYRPGDVRHVTASCARLNKELGWHAEVEFADGMRELAAEAVDQAVDQAVDRSVTTG